MRVSVNVVIGFLVLLLLTIVAKALLELAGPAGQPSLTLLQCLTLAAICATSVLLGVATRSYVKEMEETTRFKPEVRLRNWSLVKTPGTEYPLEDMSLKGDVYGHPLIPDGSEVVTGPILEVRKSQVITRNHIYILLDPSPEFVTWLESRGKSLNKDNPLKFS